MKAISKELVVKIGEYLLLEETTRQMWAEMDKQGISDEQQDEATKELCAKRLKLIREVSQMDKIMANEMIVNSDKLKKIYGIAGA